MIDLLHALDSPDALTVVAPPGAGPGHWAGAPSAVVSDGVVWLAYRLRSPGARGYANVIARSIDGCTVDPVATLTSAQFGCASLERPALVRRPDGGWRVYLSCATPGSKHWWVEALDAETPAGLPAGRRTVVLPGSDAEAWKDVVVHVDNAGWRMWACRHPLDGGDAAADRMSTWYLTSWDGLAWTTVAEALRPTAGSWAERGTRITEVIRADGRWWALYDGRRSAEENFMERTGLAVGDDPRHFTPVAGPVPQRPGTALRYARALREADGWRLYVERGTPDGAHRLQTTRVPGRVA